MKKILTILTVLLLSLTVGCGSLPDKDKSTSNTVPNTEKSNIEELSEPSNVDKMTGLPLPTFQGGIVHVDNKDIIIPAGAISGRVLYYDGTPAQDCLVYLFDSKPEGYRQSTAYTFTTEDGYYLFDNLSSGYLSYDGEEWKVSDSRKYDIFPVSNIPPNWNLMVYDSWPHVTVTVHENETTTAPTIKVSKPE